LLILPPYLKFVTQVGEKSPPLGVKAINVSWTDVRFSGVAVSGDSFALYKNQCQGRLHPRSSCWVTVTFSPKKVGQFDGLLTFTDTAKGSPQTVRLRGTAIKKRDEHHGDHDGDHDDGR
jgi:Cep192 domain 4